MLRVLILILAPGLLSSAAPEKLPLKSSELFETQKVWTLHLKFTAARWAAMEPKGEPGGGGGFGGMRGGPGMADPEIELVSLQYSQFAYRPNYGVGGNILYQKSPSLQEGDGNSDLKFRASQGCSYVARS